VVMDRCMKVEHARYLGRMHWLGFNTEQITARRATIAGSTNTGRSDPPLRGDDAIGGKNVGSLSDVAP
jgi:hypothetical protein